MRGPFRQIKNRFQGEETAIFDGTAAAWFGYKKPDKNTAFVSWKRQFLTRVYVLNAAVPSFIDVKDGTGVGFEGGATLVF